MNWGTILGMTAIVIGIALFQWPRIKPERKKEKAAFIVLLALAWLLSLFNPPNLPGPTTLMHKIFQPLSVILPQ